MSLDRVLSFLQNRRGRVIGALIGLVFGVSVMVIGLFWTLFIGICVLVGYFIGKRMDEEKEGLSEILERYFPIHDK